MQSAQRTGSGGHSAPHSSHSQTGRVEPAEGEVDSPGVRDARTSPLTAETAVRGARRREAVQTRGGLATGDGRIAHLGFAG